METTPNSNSFGQAQGSRARPSSGRRLARAQDPKQAPATIDACAAPPTGRSLSPQPQQPQQQQQQQTRSRALAVAAATPAAIQQSSSSSSTTSAAIAFPSLPSPSPSPVHRTGRAVVPRAAADADPVNQRHVFPPKTPFDNTTLQASSGSAFSLMSPLQAKLTPRASSQLAEAAVPAAQSAKSKRTSVAAASASAAEANSSLTSQPPSQHEYDADCSAPSPVVRPKRLHERESAEEAGHARKAMRATAEPAAADSNVQQPAPRSNGAKGSSTMHDRDRARGSVEQRSSTSRSGTPGDARLSVSQQAASQPAAPNEDEAFIMRLSAHDRVFSETFDQVELVGDGTFGTVFRARVAQVDGAFVALKRINSLSQPARMLKEIKCIQALGGNDHTPHLLGTFRFGGDVILIMPYLMSESFRQFMRDFSVGDLQMYMKGLFRTLAYMHKSGYLHRDIKPSNYLFARTAKLKEAGFWEERLTNMGYRDGQYSYMLVDFGLTQPMNADDSASSPSSSAAGASAEASTSSTRATNTLTIAGRAKNDRRPAKVTQRAGTRGFRAPEILLRHFDQTPAIDIWSVGVILLSILTGKYPFFEALEDTKSLAELMWVFGSQDMIRLADSLGETDMVALTVHSAGSDNENRGLQVLS
ncbi:CDC7 protein kinase, variant 1 [Capsaspora owczarzaki ATCC 30864]|uniref:non-specific serine/threonine protein kinase n=1 Tax=Capsaspora owczarzaki (strain ATCC 30864) TaxID=595528 RepID=A0A0D2WQZ4_CAPO3|nr:CDC7 protein kinase, variant 1 [Capsaspora owczarzaki ATCC 30864]